MKIAGWVAGAVFVFLAVFMLATAGWDRPPISDEQSGYRGTGMADVVNPRKRAERIAAQQAPEAQGEPQPDAPGPTAGETYENVQVLQDLPVAQFTRLMQAITNWVSPEEGCQYCHESGNFASDKPYTKKVSRKMLQMTRYINGEWDQHVQSTGVTCYTCHRGNNVPQNAWWPHQARESFQGMAGNRAGQNAPAESVGLSSLPRDPFSAYLDQDQDIRVAADTALPREGEYTSIQATERSYGLMMHMSQSLGVNCTYCHNSRAFRNWEQSNPARVTAWHGIRMVRDTNRDYIQPLADVLPAKRKSPDGVPLQTNCSTCHQGLPKPLNGAPMLEDYPSLAGDGKGDDASSTASAGDDAQDVALAKE